MMDISETLSPKSDQIDYEDLISGPKTLTISEVRRGPSAEQPVEIAFEDFDRPWRPAKTVRRILVACWGADASVYTGRRVTIFGDPTVKWAGAEVGGIRLSHVSDIDKPVTVSLTVTRGRRSPFTVQPLASRDWLKELDAAGDNLEALFKLGTEARTAAAPEAVIAKILAKYKEAEADG